jgi:outer membrane protein assembly factor BamB
LNQKTGGLLWKFATDGASIRFDDFGNDRISVFCSPAIREGLVTVGGRDGFLYCIDLATGKEKWRFDHHRSWVPSTAMNEKLVFAASGSAVFVQALDRITGLEKWRFKPVNAVFSSLSLNGDMLYFGDLSGNIHALNSKTGVEKWQFPTGGYVYSNSVVSEGVVYCGSDDGFLYALQGSMAVSDSVKLKPKKIVYWERPKTDSSFNWFVNSGDIYLRNYFMGAGYELADSSRIAEVMNQQITDRGSSVIVFSDNRIPQNVVEEKSEKALIRKYLNA